MFSSYITGFWVTVCGVEGRARRNEVFLYSVIEVRFFYMLFFSHTVYQYFATDHGSDLITGFGYDVIIIEIFLHSPGCSKGR